MKEVTNLQMHRHKKLGPHKFVQKVAKVDFYCMGLSSHDLALLVQITLSRLVSACLCLSELVWTCLGLSKVSLSLTGHVWAYLGKLGFSWLAMGLPGLV